ncbi:cytochrome P450 [Gymnopilus junonius]|uniref:Cytochrome P450 n=1 Tax=Gymnopilus junonius TaxID=109634 RepID=A0A9P5NUX9_GYMJU|nr:cytochrome P450 [Gymnopilus junonius]
MAFGAIVFPIITALVTSYGVYLWQQRSRSLPLPPGPKGYPVIGNVYDIPHGFAWLTYAEWKKSYGDVMSITVFGRTTIILNSLKSCVDLLDKRSFNYSDRPRMVMATELCGWDWNFAHMPYTNEWRRHRRSFHQYFQPRNLSSQYHYQRKMVVTLLEQISLAPEKFSAHLSQFVSSIVLRAAYGYKAQPENDFYVDLAHKAIQPLLELVHAGTYLVEFLPILKYIPSWFPGAGFKVKAEALAIGARNLRDLPFEFLKRAIAKGDAERSYSYDNLEKLKTNGTLTAEEEEVIKNCSGMAYIGMPEEQTDSVLHSFILAMALNPVVQRKAQAEIDAVTGKTRLPDFNDGPSLPYIQAVLLETMRWRPTTPLGGSTAVPHRVLREDIYEGYRIPAGATLIPNVWIIFHDAEMYPDPLDFKPERFVHQEGKPTQPDPTLTGAFGFGRRICPGRYLALNSAWIAVASMLSVYDITKFIDNDGKVIEPLISYGDGVVSHPAPFKVQISLRSGSAEKLIREAKAELSI